MNRVQGTEPPPNDGPKPLAYRTPTTPGDQVEGWLATQHERFFAGVVDWFAMWIGLACVSILVSYLTRDDVIRYSVVAGWFTMHFAIDALLGRTVGRALGGLTLAGRNGHRPTRGQLFLRATIQRLWYWPMMVLIVALCAHDAFRTPFTDKFLSTIVMVLGACSVFWLVNCASWPPHFETIADRISRTRVLMKH